MSNLEMLGFGMPIAIGAVADAHGLRTALLGLAVVPVALFAVVGGVDRPVRDRATE